MRCVLLAALCIAPAMAGAQDRDAGGEPAPPGVQATELAPVRVIGRRPPTDPFAFRNPVEVEGTVFSRAWDESPSLEEVGMRGGYVQLGIIKGIELAGKCIRKLPGWTQQINDAQARPPPLDEAQAARAARLHAEAGASSMP